MYTYTLLPGEKFSPLFSLAKMLSHYFFFPVTIKDCIGALQRWLKFFYQIFCYAKIYVAGLGEIFIQQIFYANGIQLYSSLQPLSADWSCTPVYAASLYLYCTIIIISVKHNY